MNSKDKEVEAPRESLLKHKEQKNLQCDKSKLVY